MSILDLVNGSIILSNEASDYPSLPSPDEFLNKIIPHPWALLIQFLAFLILVAVFIYFGYKPVRKLLNKRKDHVESTILDAENKKKEAEKLLADSKLEVIENRKKIEDSLLKSKETALKIKEQTLKDAELEADEIKLNARKQIDKEIEAAKEGIRSEMIDIALSASEELLSRKLDKDDDKKIVSDYIKDVK